jgi:hypothetical protein
LKIEDVKVAQGRDAKDEKEKIIAFQTRENPTKLLSIFTMQIIHKYRFKCPKTEKR